MNKGEIFKKLSDSAKPKLEIVIGNNKSAEAKIAGDSCCINFKGRWDIHLIHLFPTCLLG